MSRDAGIRFVERSRLGHKDIVVPPLCPYSSILISREAESPTETISQILTHSVGVPTSRLISLPPVYSELVTSVQNDFNYRERSTYVLKTGPVEVVLSSASESTRRNFNKAEGSYRFEKSGVNPELIAGMVEDAYKRSGHQFALPAHAIGAFADSLVERGLGGTVGVFSKDTGELQAGIVYLTSESVSWYWLSGSLPGSAMTVLLIKTLAHLHEQGIEVLDLMGANTQGIAEFKRRFGGQLVSYSHLESRTLTSRLIDSAGILARKLKY